jgi:hypothetical protein
MKIMLDRRDAYERMYKIYLHKFHLLIEAFIEMASISKDYQYHQTFKSKY